MCLYAATAVLVPVLLYAGLLGILATVWGQRHAVYLNALQLTWSKDLDYPEVFGFLLNQVTPFYIRTTDLVDLYAWHILPVDLYSQYETELSSEAPGLIYDMRSRLAFRLLQSDEQARLVICLHGAAGTVASGYRTTNYRALYAGRPGPIHVLTFDYRDFGRTKGSPSEEGLLRDAIAVVDWAMDVARVDPSRIIIFGQSLGTAVSTAIAEHYVLREPPVVFAGHIHVASFLSIPTLVSTYRIAGIIPSLGPLVRLPAAFGYMLSLIRDTWSTETRIVKYVRTTEAKGLRYNLTFIHAEDDCTIPWGHTLKLFEKTAIASLAKDEGLRDVSKAPNVGMLRCGKQYVWRTTLGTIRQEISRYGLHDKIMGDPIITLAVMKVYAEGTSSLRFTTSSETH